VTKRVRWSETTNYPGNTIYPKRLAYMRANGPGYNPFILGTPELLDNSDGTIPDWPTDKLIRLTGNHRYELAVAEGHDDDEFVAKIHRSLIKEQAARLRRGESDKRSIKPAEVFLELVDEGNSTNFAIKQEINGLGWEITEERSIGGLSCTNELRWIWTREGGRAAMTLAVQTYERAFGQKPHSAQGRVVKGLGAFWVAYPDADMDRLVRALKGLDQQQLYDSGRMLAGKSEIRLSFIKGVHDGVRYSIAQHYNRESRKGVKLPATSVRYPERRFA
jgi:hypothetical protein